MAVDLDLALQHAMAVAARRVIDEPGEMIDATRTSLVQSASLRVGSSALPVCDRGHGFPFHPSDFRREREEFPRFRPLDGNALRSAFDCKDS